MTTDETSPARSLRQSVGRNAPGVGRIGRRPGRRQSGQLAHASRIRVGKPRLETLDPVLFRALPVRALRRAGMRHERLAGSALSIPSVGGGSGVGDRCRSTGRTGDAARHLTGWGGVHPVRDPPSGTRRADDSLWSLRTRRVAARHAGRQAEYQAMVDLARVAWGKDNPTFRQVFTSRFIPGGSPSSCNGSTTSA